MKLPKQSSKGFTLIELLVVIAIIAILASLAVPAITGALVKGQLTQTMNNGRQIYLAGFQMATDATVQGDARLGWPGDLAVATANNAQVSSVGQYLERLRDYDYLKEGDLIKVMQAPGMAVWEGRGQPINGTRNCAFKIYKVRDGDGANAVFCATQNFTYGAPLDVNRDPYKDKGFVVVRKGGDGAAYKKQQSQSTELLGLLPGRQDLNDRPSEGPDDILQQQ